MRFAASFLALLLAFAASAWAQDQAFINRPSELKDRAAADARTLATLPENTAVKVIARGGSGWTQVDANGQQGWVKAFHLRFPATIDKSASSSGGTFSSITSALSGRQSEKATIATTGVRGLSPDDLKKASPDAAALAKAQSYRADKPTAERFAREGKLVAVTVEEGGRR
jgi:uncharacterized protein YgiM (DUF1202 family)